MDHKKHILLALILVAIAVAGRFLPHAWNFTPLVAVSLFAGTYLPLRYALFVPLMSMAVSDIFIGFYDIRVMIAVYACFAATGFVGLYIKKSVDAGRILASSLAASIAFFAVTNAAVWLWSGMYGPGISGLVDSLVAGIPFFRNMVVGDLWFSFTLFGAYELAKAWKPLLITSAAKARS